MDTPESVGCTALNSQTLGVVCSPLVRANTTCMLEDATMSQPTCKIVVTGASIKNVLQIPLPTTRPITENYIPAFNPAEDVMGLAKEREHLLKDLQTISSIHWQELGG